MAEVYNTDRFGELYYASRMPTALNLGLAARYICRLLNASGIQYVLIGGWAIYLRGSGRRTQDVDVAVGTSMDHLKHVLLSDSRIYFPAIHGQTCVQVFVKTGRSVDPDYTQAEDLAVSLDIVISGNLGTPSDISNASDHIVPGVNTPLGNNAVVLGLSSQVSAKLAAFADRGAQSGDDFRDLIFLLTMYEVEISAFRDSLSEEQRRLFTQRYAALFGEDNTLTARIRQIFNL